MKNRKLRIYATIITIMFILASVAFSLVFFRENYPYRIAVRMGWADGDNYQINHAVRGWNNTLEKLDYDADIVFFGDSITCQSDFREYFPDKKIVTLGFPGDNLRGMQERVEGVAAVTPEQVFVLGGINGLQSYTVQVGIERYDTLLSLMKEQMPDTEIFVLSVLPVNEEMGAEACSNDVIDEFNEKIKVLAQNYGCTYVDINSLYKDDNGAMDKELTKDGVHLYPEAYDRWAEQIRPYIEK